MEFSQQAFTDMEPGALINATATDGLGLGSTSELSDCIQVTGTVPTPTPGPTSTPTATPSPTPTGTGPTPTGGQPTPTPTGSPLPKLAQGDVQCDDDVDSVDALQQLRDVAGLTTFQEDNCPEIASAGAIFGDVDCDSDVDSVDALKVLRHVAALAVAQTEPCTDIGDPL